LTADEEVVAAAAVSWNSILEKEKWFRRTAIALGKS